MKKRVIALLMAGAMVFSLAACGSTDSSDATNDTSAAETDTENDSESETEVSGDASFLIGYPTSASYNAVMNAMHLNRSTIAEAAGGELVTEIFEFDDATTIDAVEKLITDGCAGIFVTPVSNDVLYNVTDMCDEAGVYFVISMRSITDDDVKAYVEDSDYYLGCVYEDEYQAGYMLGQALYESGATNYCLLTTSADNTTGQTREQGLADAAEEFGLNCLDTYRDPADATEAVSAVESWIAKYGSEMEGIVRLGSNATGDQSAIGAKLEEYSSYDIKFVTLDTDENCVSYLEDGTITATLGDLLIQDSIAAATILTNAVTGNSMSDEPVELALQYSIISDAEELEAYYEYMAVDEPIYTTDEIPTSLLALDIDGLEDLCNSMTALEVKELHESR